MARRAEQQREDARLEAKNDFDELKDGNIDYTEFKKRLTVLETLGLPKSEVKTFLEQAKPFLLEQLREEAKKEFDDLVAGNIEYVQFEIRMAMLYDRGLPEKEGNAYLKKAEKYHEEEEKEREKKETKEEKKKAQRKKAAEKRKAKKRTEREKKKEERREQKEAEQYERLQKRTEKKEESKKRKEERIREAAEHGCPRCEVILNDGRRCPRRAACSRPFWPCVWGEGDERWGLCWKHAYEAGLYNPIPTWARDRMAPTHEDNIGCGEWKWFREAEKVPDDLKGTGPDDSVVQGEFESEDTDIYWAPPNEAKAKLYRDRHYNRSLKAGEIGRMGPAELIRNVHSSASMPSEVQAVGRAFPKVPFGDSPEGPEEWRYFLRGIDLGKHDFTDEQKAQVEDYGVDVYGFSGRRRHALPSAHGRRRRRSHLTRR